jgi:acyl-CoA synthetase (AMP-forming)/AMP-acid ligase II
MICDWRPEWNALHADAQARMKARQGAGNAPVCASSPTTARTWATATEAAIIDHVRARLARFTAPKSVTFTELPRASAGKIQKFVPQDRAWAGRQRRIH